MRNSSGRRRPSGARRPSITSRRKATACLESCTLPGRFFTRRIWPICARWAPTVVPVRGPPGGAQAARPVEVPQIPADQLQAAVRGQLVTPELDLQLPLDHPSQARYAQTHQGGLLCVGSDVGTSAPLQNAQEGVLFLRILNQCTPQLFSDWG